jgi:serine/threonine-protein kinase RsbW
MPIDRVTGRLTLTLRNTLEDLPPVHRAAERLLTEQNVEADPAYLVSLAIEELVSNVIRHGFEDSRIHEIGVTIEVRPSTVDLTVEDDGRPFDPNTVGELETPASLEAAPTGGMGVSLVKGMAGPIQYVRTGTRNRATVRIPR